MGKGNCRRPGKRALFIHIPDALNDMVQDYASKERLSATSVVIMALEAFLQGRGYTIGAAREPEPPTRKTASRKKRAKDS
jgi:hypothetical protein